MSVKVTKGKAQSLGSCNSCGWEGVVFEVVCQGLSFRMCDKCFSSMRSQFSNLGYRKKNRNASLKVAYVKR